MFRFPLFDRVCCTVSHQCKRFASSPRLISPESIFWARVQCSLTEGEVIVAESFSGNFLFDCHHLKITNHPQGAGCCTRCFKCSWNQLIVNISLKNQCWCFCWILLLSPHNAPQSPDRPAAPRLVLMHNQQTIRQVAEITTRSVWQRLQWSLFDIFTLQVSSTIWGAIIGAKKLSSLEIRLIW